MNEGRIVYISQKSAVLGYKSGSQESTQIMTDDAIISTHELKMTFITMIDIKYSVHLHFCEIKQRYMQVSIRRYKDPRIKSAILVLGFVCAQSDAHTSFKI